MKVYRNYFLLCRCFWCHSWCVSLSNRGLNEILTSYSKSKNTITIECFCLISCSNFPKLSMPRRVMLWLQRNASMSSAKSVVVMEYFSHKPRPVSYRYIKNTKLKWILHLFNTIVSKGPMLFAINALSKALVDKDSIIFVGQLFKI